MNRGHALANPFFFACRGLVGLTRVRGAGGSHPLRFRMVGQSRGGTRRGRAAVAKRQAGEQRG